MNGDPQKRPCQPQQNAQANQRERPNWVASAIVFQVKAPHAFVVLNEASG
jgi:hypothetical protein